MARVQYGMVRAMGMGMRVLELLSDGIREQGGNEEVLRFLTQPRFKSNLDLICRTIAECDWRIPASVMRDLAWKHRTFSARGGLREYIRNLWWSNVCIELGIPYTIYSNDPTSGFPAIPPGLLNELRDRKMEYPLLVMSGRYVVVNFWAEDGEPPRPGEYLKANKIGQIGLAESRYFDFDK